MRLVLCALALTGCLESREGALIEVDTVSSDTPASDTAAPDTFSCQPTLTGLTTTVAIEATDGYGVEDQPEDILIFEGTRLWGMAYDAGFNASDDWLVVSEDMAGTGLGARVEHVVPTPGLTRWVIADARDGLALVSGHVYGGTGAPNGGQHVVALVGDIDQGSRILHTADRGALLELPQYGQTPRYLDGELVAWSQQETQGERVGSVYVHTRMSGETTKLDEIDGRIFAVQVAGGRVAWLALPTFRGGEVSRPRIKLWRVGSFTEILIDDFALDLALTRRHLYVQTPEAVWVLDLATHAAIATHPLNCSGLTTDGVRAIASCGLPPDSHFPFARDRRAHLFDGPEVVVLPSVSADPVTVGALALEGATAAWIESAPEAGCVGVQDLGTLVVAEVDRGGVAAVATTRIPCLCCGREWAWPAVRVTGDRVAWRYGVPELPDPGEAYYDPWFTHVGVGVIGPCQDR